MRRAGGRVDHRQLRLGVIPVQVRIGQTEFRTSLFPKEGGYLVPVKAAVRKTEEIDEGDVVPVRLTLDT